MIPLINILVRTSDRKNQFNSIISQLTSQTYTNWLLHVHVDTPETIQYVKDIGICHNIYVGEKIHRNNKDHNPYNLYMNTLINGCDNGWVWCIDDDDFIPNDTILETIASNLIDNNYIHIFKVKTHLNQIIPRNNTIVYGNITTANPIMPISLAKLAPWKDCRGGDYHWITDTLKITGNDVIRWHDAVIYHMGTPNHGNNPASRNPTSIYTNTEMELIRKRHRK